MRNLFRECKKLCNLTNLSLWILLVFGIPLFKFCTTAQTYAFTSSYEVFNFFVGDYIPLLFPAITSLIFLPSFIKELRNHFLVYTRTRIPLKKYLQTKLLTNLIFSGMISFLMIFIPFIISIYIVPYFNFIEFLPEGYAGGYDVTFSQFIPYGSLVYGFIYSGWVALNAILYATIGFLLLFLVRNIFLALSLPFVFYTLAHFMMNVLNLPEFSPLDSIFPFGIVQQPLWTVTLPFITVVLCLGCILFMIVKKPKEEMMQL